ncbi:MAG: 2-nitropropane dioxygenase [Nitrospirota bacterium]
MTPSVPTAGESGRLIVTCPCCHAELTVDAATGAVIWHHPEPAPPQRSLNDLVKELDVKRQEVADRFERERRALNDRSRLLEEKVKESLKRVDPNAPPPIRPIDLD